MPKLPTEPPIGRLYFVDYHAAFGPMRLTVAEAEADLEILSEKYPQASVVGRMYYPAHSHQWVADCQAARRGLPTSSIRHPLPPADAGKAGNHRN